MIITHYRNDNPNKKTTNAISTQWETLWKELAEIQNRRKELECKRLGCNDFWADKADDFYNRVQKRWKHMDSSRDLILSKLSVSDTLLDIGAGTGAWSLLLADKVRSVTAIEPSDSMAAILTDQIKENRINNIELMRNTWPGLEVDKHDFSLCSHAMYETLDFKKFVKKMIAATRKTCFLLIRAPYLDGIMGQAANLIHGHRYDSPNFHIAYNILLEMGIHPNVLMESRDSKKKWEHETLKDALIELKERLGVHETKFYDSQLISLLRENLRYQNGLYLWPPTVRSALIYWDN